MSHVGAPSDPETHKCKLETLLLHLWRPRVGFLVIWGSCWSPFWELFDIICGAKLNVVFFMLVGAISGPFWRRLGL